MKFATSENMHGDEMRYVFEQHDQILEEKNMAISQLKALLDKETCKYNQLEGEFRFQKSKEQKLVAEYEQALMKYRNRVNQLEQDLQIIYQSLEDEKMQHSKTKETWIAEINQFKKSLQEKEAQNGRLRDEVNSLLNNTEHLQADVNQLITYKEQLESKLMAT